MKTNLFSRAAFFCALAACGLFSTANAGLLIPNGNPTGTNPATGTGGSSVLTPAPASYRIAGDCPWVQPALDAQGYSKANGWTTNKIALTGNLELDTYAPWVNTAPAITQGKLSVGAAASNGLGGAAFGLNYQPGKNDPSGASVHWISVIYENVPLAYEKANGAAYGNGYTVCLDNGYNGGTKAPGNPFYDDFGSGYAGNPTDFLDRPSDKLRSNADIEFQTFVATWNPNNANDVTKGGTINLYDGVWWGFMLPAPEPSSAALAASGAFLLFVFAWRKSRKP